jgi:hypothetical protein
LRRLLSTASVRLIVLYDPTVTDHISGRRGGEATLNAFLGHVTHLPSQKADHKSLLATRGVHWAGQPFLGPCRDYPGRFEVVRFVPSS